MNENMSVVYDTQKANTKKMVVLGDLVNVNGTEYTFTSRRYGFTVVLEESWIKNIKDVKKELANETMELTGIAKVLKAKGYEYPWDEVMRMESIMNKIADDSFEGKLLEEKQRRYFNSWNKLTWEAEH